MPGRNKRGMFAEQELVLGNSWFSKTDLSKYTWVRIVEGRMVERALVDYVLLLGFMIMLVPKR